jgi:cytochrome c-type biogenesis protein CcmF
VWPAIGIGLAMWLIVGATADVADRIALFRRPAQAWQRAKGLPRSAWGAAIAHAGMGVTIAGIAGMGVATDTLIALKPGETARLAGYEWRLDSIVDAQGPNYASRLATITVSRNGAVVTVLSPERRTFQVDRQTTTEAAIHTNAMRDLYAVLGEERDGAGVLRLHHNPLAPWIWFGCIIMAIGGGLSLSDRRMRVAAPAPKGATAPA